MRVEEQHAQYIEQKVIGIDIMINVLYSEQKIISSSIKTDSKRQCANFFATDLNL